MQAMPQPIKSMAGTKTCCSRRRRQEESGRARVPGTPGLLKKAANFTNPIREIRGMFPATVLSVNAVFPDGFHHGPQVFQFWIFRYTAGSHDVAAAFPAGFDKLPAAGFYVRRRAGDHER